jgi:cysteine desulfurase
MSDPIYLDYNATTPIAPEVQEAMQPALATTWGNPSSSHVFGLRAREALEHARGQVAALLGSDSEEIVFTSGGTESDNAAIVGVAETLADRGRHLVTTQIEHPAVESVCRYLERRGWEVTRVAVDRDGRVPVPAVVDALRPDTTLVSVMHANNETGVLQPLREIGAVCRPRKIPFHTDAAQSVGKIPTRVETLGVDLLTVAGHKLYGPKGVGALYLRHGTPFSPFLHGAGHERGRRPGTENVSQIVGLGAACEIALAEIDSRPVHLAALTGRLERALRDRIDDLVVHGAGADRLPNTLSAAIPGVDANALVSRIDDVAIAAGAACHAGAAEVSSVLRAMEVPDDLALCTVRLTVGRPTTEEEIDRAALRIAGCALAMR